jgi:hypothetical protein
MQAFADRFFPSFIESALWLLESEQAMKKTYPTLPLLMPFGRSWKNGLPLSQSLSLRGSLERRCSFLSLKPIFNKRLPSYYYID